MIEVTFLGRGGQGAFTSSRILAIAASLYGDKYALSFPSFGPARRAAPVFAYTKIHRFCLIQPCHGSQIYPFCIIFPIIFNFLT